MRTNQQINDVQWGVEFETVMPDTDTTIVGYYHHGRQVPWLFEGWKAERDTSIRPTVGQKGVEFVSPKMKGREGLTETIEAVKRIKERGAKVNKSCGVHVTIEWNGDAAALARLITLVGNHEKAIFASTGTPNRETVHYTKKIKQYGNDTTAKNKCEGDRYHMLNLTHLANGKNRIEFRAFAGTLNTNKIAGHIQMCLGLVEIATTAKRKASWDYTKKEGTKSCWDREGAGKGETELRRLFYRLGWTKGWYKGELKNKRFGDISTTDSASDIKEVKKTLTTMSRKYDAVSRPWS